MLQPAVASNAEVDLRPPHDQVIGWKGHDATGCRIAQDREQLSDLECRTCRALSHDFSAYIGAFAADDGPLDVVSPVLHEGRERVLESVLLYDALPIGSATQVDRGSRIEGRR